MTAFDYGWLTDALAKKDASVTSKIVRSGQFVVLVATRGAKLSCLPVEGVTDVRIDGFGGMTINGAFWLGAEGDEVREKFIDQALHQLESPAAKRRTALSPFAGLFGSSEG